MVIALSGVVTLAQYFSCHCTHHCTTLLEQESHHHHCSSDDDCTNHRSSVEHNCTAQNAIDGTSEFIPSTQLRTQDLTTIVTLYICVASKLFVASDEEDDLDDWRCYDLYRGFDPTCSLLRAPPALV